MSGIVRRHVDWNGGEARLLKLDGTRFEAEFVRGDHAFFVTWDPRDEGIDLRVDAQHWSRPSGAPMDDADRRAMIDRLWSFSGDSDGTMRSVLVLHEKTGCFVAERWSRDDEGFLVRVRNDGIDYHELGRTLVLGGERVPGLNADGLRVMQVRRPKHWADPRGAALDDVQWSRVRANFERAVEGDMFDTDPGWRVTTND
jgi:hypothetical protein